MKSILISVPKKKYFGTSFKEFSLIKLMLLNTNFGIQYTFITQKGSTFIMWQAALKKHCRSFTGQEK